MEVEFIGDQAFIEGNILVHKILFKNIPKIATNSQVINFIQTLGKVRSADCIDRVYGRCIVHFGDSKDAARVLRKRKFLVWNTYITVEICDSSLQPDGQELIKLLHQTKYKLNCSKANTTDQKALILTLNDDCLQHICKKLPNRDRINFALTCQRFYDVLEMVSKVEYAIFDAACFERTLYQNMILLQIAGQYIKTLTISGKNKETKLTVCGLYCTRVEKLIVEGYIRIESFYKLIEKMSLLQHIQIVDKNVSKRVKYINRCPHLASNITQSCRFKDICENLKKLHYLEISNCFSLGIDDYEHISKHLLELQTLKLFVVNEDITCLAKLPKLRNLEIRFYNIRHLNNFLNLNAADQLEELRISFLSFTSRFIHMSCVAELKKLKLLHLISADVTNEVLLILSQLPELQDIVLDICYNVTDNSVLKLLGNCLKLKRLRLAMKNDRFTPNFHLKVRKLLEEKRSEPVIFISDVIDDWENKRLYYPPTDDLGVIKIHVLQPIDLHGDDHLFEYFYDVMRDDAIDDDYISDQSPYYW